MPKIKKLDSTALKSYTAAGFNRKAILQSKGMWAQSLGTLSKGRKNE
jgi:hypothetical protein